ncbi:hypothetical protein ES703_69734 [subsurface metagenome]
MKGVSPKFCILVVVVILAVAYFVDFNMFKALLTWALGGIIVLLLNVAFFSDLLGTVMKNEEVQDLIKLFQEGKEHLKRILENQKGKKE